MYIQKKLAWKKNEFAFYKKCFKGRHPHGSSWVYSIAVLLTHFWGILDIDVPTTDLFLRKYTQHHLITQNFYTIGYV